MSKFRQSFTGPPQPQSFTINENSMQAAGLVAWLPPLGVGFGTGRVIDYARNTPAALSGGMYSATDPIVGGCWVGDHSDNTIVLTYTPHLNPASITLSAWVKLNAIDGTDAIISNAFTPGWATYRIEHMPTGKLEFVYHDSGSTYHAYTTGATVLTAATWAHVAVAFTYGTGAGIVIYVNGVAVGGSWTQGNGNGALHTTAANTIIGAYIATNDPIDGCLSDVRIYDRRLSASEVWQLYDPITRWELYKPQRSLWSLGTLAPVVTASQLTVEVDVLPLAVVTASQMTVEVDVLDLPEVFISQVLAEVDVLPVADVFVSQVLAEVDVLETFSTRAMSGLSGLSGMV